MTQSLTICPLCTLCGWEGEVFNCGSVAGNQRINGYVPILAQWRCSNKHSWATLIVVTKVEENDERRD